MPFCVLLFNGVFGLPDKMESLFAHIRVSGLIIKVEAEVLKFNSLSLNLLLKSTKHRFKDRATEG